MYTSTLLCTQASVHNVIVYKCTQGLVLQFVLRSHGESARVTEDAAEGGAAQEVDGWVQEVDEGEDGSESYSGNNRIWWTED